MFETVIILKPHEQWRRKSTWYSGWAPGWLKPLFRRVTPDRLSREELVEQMDAALRAPGLSNAWTMPVKARIDMLSTGIRTPVGLKITGNDWDEIERLGSEVEKALASAPGTRSVYAERTSSGYFLDFTWNRTALSRYGLSMQEAQTAVQNAIGVENVTTVIRGRERIPVNVRYMRDFRSDLDSLGRVLVSASGGRKQIPLAELAQIRSVPGPAMLRDENGMLTGYVYVDLAGRDPGSYVAEASRLVRAKVQPPPGCALLWSGQFEAMERVRERMKILVPFTLFLIVLLLYANTRSAAKTGIVLLAVPFSAIGAVWFLYALGYNMSVAAWVGLLALLGVDAETGVFMLLYLDLAYRDARREGRLRTAEDLRAAVMSGAVKRLRPKFMTVATTMLGLVPIMWSTGAGSDVMKRIAAPMIGGIVTSFALELLVYPVVFESWKWASEVGRWSRQSKPLPAEPDYAVRSACVKP
jgi:Cu(I)/Ag(I) efflux system membrane protein CusA/SilA